MTQGSPSLSKACLIASVSGAKNGPASLSSSAVNFLLNEQWRIAPASRPIANFETPPQARQQSSYPIPLSAIFRIFVVRSKFETNVTFFKNSKQAQVVHYRSCEGFFTPKNLAPPKKSRKIRINLKYPKNLKKSKKPRDFFEDSNSVHLIWEWTTPRIQWLNPFLFIKSS